MKMTPEQFNAWKSSCINGGTEWKLDCIHNGQDREDSLFYNAYYMNDGTGWYVLERGDGFLELGTYENAFSHIGDGAFQALGRKQYASREEALSRAVQAGIALPTAQSPREEAKPALEPAKPHTEASPEMVPTHPVEERTVSISSQNSFRSIKTRLNTNQALLICSRLEGFPRKLYADHQRWGKLSSNQWNWVLYLAQESINKQTKPAPVPQVQQPQEEPRSVPAIPAPIRSSDPDPIGVSLKGEDGMEKVADLLARGRKAGLVRPKIYLVVPGVKGASRNRFYFLSPYKIEGWLLLRQKGAGYLGKISSDGLLLPAGRNLEAQHPGLVEALQRLTADPEASMKEYATVTHSCMFCTKTLTEPDSIEASCGWDCSRHYGVAYGKERLAMTCS